MGKTIAEKIFDSHLVDNPFEGIHVIRLDAVFCHEITTPVALNDLVARGLDRVFDPTKIKAVIDHVTPAKDSKTAMQGKILREWANRHNIKDFFDVGRNGVCHAIFPEKGFVRPGYTVIMGDSHTCTHGAFGAFAAGVGTTDLEVGILKGVCAFHYPESIKIEIRGTLSEGVYAKDVILSIIGKLGVNGATNKVIEFCGEVIENMSMEARMTLCNMAIEAGGTSGICAPDMTTVDYLWTFIKDEFASKEEAADRRPPAAPAAKPPKKPLRKMPAAPPAKPPQKPLRKAPPPSPPQKPPREAPAAPPPQKPLREAPAALDKLAIEQ